MSVERRGEFAFDYLLHEGTAPTKVQFHFLEELNLPVAIQTWELPVGGSEGMHRHDGEQALEEFYLVVEGSARMHLGDEILELEAGDTALAPAGVDHDLINAGEGPLRILTVWGTPGAADFSSFGSARASKEARALAADRTKGPSGTPPSR
ncbi:MAG: cupin domain-containing protein [Arthrobacter sp.]|uniref:cupin domain-containing protein n=1 Tax=unclassified Arthrobacter TaxID=235627 RepID=UPI00264CF446|nr:cupin domain-containing protein [Micrococcaceae bacterium]MDN5812678.1 cupin domain-containing protein [Micrococcaceae bacterium]MDN5825006.1 cupin domain-containing protein [Micrococcaceae bacterium]MDN5879370.1 cupin domain-containing protein [Micrococcaceae bacterium]MDN5887679.1 cupin domain-containing protein [Micrococcaceae bacterium]